MSKLLRALVLAVLTAAPAVAEDSSTPALQTAQGMFMFDYQTMQVDTGGQIDLFGIQYLQQFNNWLYWGSGLSAPLVQGNYGGFFTASATLHAQKEFAPGWFVDAGLSLGAGSGGTSVDNIKEISGSGA